MLTNENAVQFPSQPLGRTGMGQSGLCKGRIIFYEEGGSEDFMGGAHIFCRT